MKTAYILTVRRLLFVLIDDCFALSFFIPTANETISNREENNLHDCYYAEHQRSTEDLIGQRVLSCAVISCDTLWSVNSIAGRDQPKTHQVHTCRWGLQPAGFCEKRYFQSYKLLGDSKDIIRLEIPLIWSGSTSLMDPMVCEILMLLLNILHCIQGRHPIV